MPNFERDLGELINRGVTISEDKDNRMYLRSSFKRTVNGWKSDYNKLKKNRRHRHKEIQIRKRTPRHHRKTRK